MYAIRSYYVLVVGGADRLAVAGRDVARRGRGRRVVMAGVAVQTSGIGPGPVSD